MKLVLTLTNSNLIAELPLDKTEMPCREYFIQYKNGGGDIKLKRIADNNFAYIKTSPTNSIDFSYSESGAGYSLTNLARYGSIVFELINPLPNTEIDIVIFL